jgi:hypothetical protein
LLPLLLLLLWLILLLHLRISLLMQRHLVRRQDLSLFGRLISFR